MQMQVLISYEWSGWNPGTISIEFGWEKLNEITFIIATKNSCRKLSKGKRIYNR